MKIARLTDYAFVILAALRDRRRTSAFQLAEFTTLPDTTVSKVLKMLVRAGLVVSTRGAQGGYVLARPAEDINLAAVIEAMEGPISLTKCTDQAEEECALSTHCNSKSHWHDVNSIIRGALANVSILELGLPLL